MTKPLVTSMACVTISCPEPNKLINLITEVWDWEIFCHNELSQTHENLWGIKNNSAGIKNTILRSKGSDRGMIRVVEGKQRIRQSPMSTRWSGIEIVVMDDLVGLCKSLQNHYNFEVVKPVDEADFTHAGANVHKFFHGIGPGLTHMMFTMAVTEPEEYAFPESPNRVGHIFDVHLDVDKKDDSRDFYHKTLAMDMVFDDMLEEGLFFDTWDLDASSPSVQMSIFKGDADGFGLGGIEMRSFDSSTMDPTPPIPHTFDGGTCMTTFTVKDIDKVFAVLSESGSSDVLSSPKKINSSPYNGGKAFAVLGPKGERLEFSEKWENE